MTDRLRAAWEQILIAILPSLATYVRWEYRVTGVQPGPPVLVSGSPVAGACPFGTLANITLWPGPSGCYALPAVGSLVLVEFHEGNPAKPSVCGLDPNVPPTEIVLGAGQDPIALSALVSGELTKIATALVTHVHAGVTTGPGTSGVAAPVYQQGAVASTLPVVSS